MAKILNILPQKIIEYSFYLLFFLVPLVLTPLNYELFEYNKMMVTYGLTTIIVGFWIIKIIINKRLNIRRTPLDMPLLLFLASQVTSTIFSIDRHVSLWGYYSRFNGGLLSIISYFLLYFAFVSNFPKEKIRKLLFIVLSSGLLVSVYGILEHFGIDRDIWVQDVQNRVFSTLGQPNWLAAYLAVLIPITFGLSIISKFQAPNNKQTSNSKHQITNKQFRILNLKNWNLFGIWNLEFGILSIIFYLTLLFTKSRSGFLGLWISLIIFLLLYNIPYILTIYKSKISSLYWTAVRNSANYNKLIGIYIISLIFITFIFGTPFDQINRFSLPELINNQQSRPKDDRPLAETIKPTGGSVIDVGITESGTIRKIVWKGAVDIFKNYPLFGSGVETFAFAYYKYRPVEHNMTSEWDFLYNKAHNEYLNYAATTGVFGLGSYLLIILFFTVWFIYQLKWEVGNVKLDSDVRSGKKNLTSHFNNLTSHFLLLTSLFSAWLSILITNFFGFSVVIIQLFFFLIPAIVFVLSNKDQRPKTNDQIVSTKQYFFCIIVTFSIVYILYYLSRLWYADIVFADGYHKARAQEVTAGYQSLKRALEINDAEPLYYDEFSFPAAQLAVALADEKQATLSAALTREAIIASNFAVTSAPQNINFWKTRTRVFYTLSVLDEKYFSDALYALEQAKILSPTDPKVRYNLGLLYDKTDQKEKAVSELLQTTTLKPDYRDAFYALSYLYEKDNKRDKAKEALQYILTKIATDDAEAKKKLEELK